MTIFRKGTGKKSADRDFDQTCVLDRVRGAETKSAFNSALESRFVHRRHGDRCVYDHKSCLIRSPRTYKTGTMSPLTADSAKKIHDTRRIIAKILISIAIARHV